MAALYTYVNMIGLDQLAGKTASIESVMMRYE